MIYVITGHLGSGKSLLAVRLAHDYLRAKKRVASNITLHLDELCPRSSRLSATKLPYIPTADHLKMLGRGDVVDAWGEVAGAAETDDYDEDKFGLILLDEAGTWLNSRDWNDKGRRELFSYLTHARKYGWDVALLVQDYEALDAQIRRSITEIYVRCFRLDRIKVPYLPIKLPKSFVASGLYGGPNGMRYKRWLALGSEYFKAYRTREAVRMQSMYDDTGKEVDMRAPYSMLSAWHLRGRYLPPRPTPSIIVTALIKWSFILLMQPIYVVGLTRSGWSTTYGGMRKNFLDDLSALVPGLMPVRAQSVYAARGARR